METVIFLIIFFSFIGYGDNLENNFLFLDGFFEWLASLFDFDPKPFCAEKFDEMVEFYYKSKQRVDAGGIDRQGMLELFEELERLQAEFKSNNCIESWDDWVNEVEYRAEARTIKKTLDFSTLE